MKKSQILFTSQLPSPRAFPSETVLFYDSILLKNKKFKSWARRFPYQLPLKAGESLKSMDSFKWVLEQIQRLEVPQTTELTFVAVGGGSVGDFVGFLASVYLRGRRLIHIPSTWLAAVDSSHGGKNGLNLAAGKNQIGRFHPAEKIYIVKDLLFSQPSERLHEALGEFVKASIINDPTSFSFLEKNVFQLDGKKAWQVLPRLIKAKYKIVQQDPEETRGLRRVLNLGHTMGHVFESYYGWPHGLCVMLGTLFSLRWSYHLKITDEKTYVRVSNLIDDIWPEQKLSDDLAGLSPKTIAAKLMKDKKRTSKSSVDFIFVKRVGQVQRRKVQIDEILTEVQRQMAEY